MGLFGTLGEGTGAVGLQQAAQVLCLSLNVASHIGLADLDPVFHVLKDQRVVGNVVVAEDGGLLALEGLVRDDADAAGVVDEGIARDTAGGLIGAAETAVDDDKLAAALDGAFALLGLDGDVAVDDMAVGAFQSKLLQDLLADGGILIEGVIGVLGLGSGALILDEAALEGGHTVTAEDGAVAAGP